MGVAGHLLSIQCDRWIGYLLSHFSQVQLFSTLWTVASQASLSTGLSRQEYWNGLPFPPPGHLPDPGIKPASPALQEDSLLLSHQGCPDQWIRQFLKLPHGTFLVAQWARILSQCRWCGFNPWMGKISWRKKWQPTPVFLLGKSPWTEKTGGLHTVCGVAKGLDMT